MFGVPWTWPVGVFMGALLVTVVETVIRRMRPAKLLAEFPYEGQEHFGQKLVEFLGSDSRRVKKFDGSNPMDLGNGPRKGQAVVPAHIWCLFMDGLVHHDDGVWFGDSVVRVFRQGSEVAVGIWQKGEKNPAGYLILQ